MKKIKLIICVMLLTLCSCSYNNNSSIESDKNTEDVLKPMIMIDKTLYGISPNIDPIVTLPEAFEYYGEVATSTNNTLPTEDLQTTNQEYIGMKIFINTKNDSSVFLEVKQDEFYIEFQK